jgi:hypothetical protein
VGVFPGKLLYILSLLSVLKLGSTSSFFSDIRKITPLPSLKFFLVYCCQIRVNSPSFCLYRYKSVTTCLIHSTDNTFPSKNALQ